VEKATTMPRSASLSIGREGDQLPILDPILMLTYFAIDVQAGQSRKDKYKWAIETLKKHRNGGDIDAVAKLWRAILETYYPLFDDVDPAARLNIMSEGVQKLEQHLKGTGPDFASYAHIVTDHVYQEALDRQAFLRAEIIAADRSATERCPAEKEVIRLFQQVLLVRGGLLNKADLLWWRSPIKLNLHHVFLHFGGQRSKTISYIVDPLAKCKELYDDLRALYDAAVIKQFQDPETWRNGTPTSSVFNGSASIELLRKWLRLGW
jgi:hypothetical protein